MDRESIIQKFQDLNVWKSGGERAPHKPLLLLYAIGKLLNSETEYIPFAEAEKELKDLLKEFGPWCQRYHPEQPFWRLQNDDIWQVSDAHRIQQTASGDAYVTDLREYGVGSFPAAIAEKLKSDLGLVFEITGRLLASHFPISYHEDILQAVGIELSFGSFWQPRDPKFRHRILDAYNHECAICGFNVTLRARPVALEAAHIKWRMADGPDIAENGMALCSLHHKLFDRGAFALSEELTIVVSEDADGSAGFEEWLMRFHGKEISFPHSQMDYPNEEFIDWHLREVFKG